MSTINLALDAITALQERLALEDTATTEDIQKAEATVTSARDAVHDAIAEATNVMRAAIDAAFGQVLRDLQSVRELRRTAILNAIGSDPDFAEVGEGASAPRRQAAE